MEIFTFMQSILKETLDILSPSDLTIIDIDGCFSDSYDIDLPNGETVDCSDVAAQFRALFRINQLSILSNEEPFSALIDKNGKVYGGIVVSYGMSDDDSDNWENPNVQKQVTFSIAIDSRTKRSGWGRNLVQHLINNRKSYIIKAHVINPHMIPLLTSLGFKRENEQEENETIFLLHPKRYLR